MNRTKKYQSVLDKEAYISQESDKAFTKFIPEIEKLKKQKTDPAEFPRAVICGPEEFGKIKGNKAKV